MRSIAIASLLVLAGTAAQAEVICTQHRGCFETGLKILRNGGAYSGLGYVNNRNSAPDPSFNPKPKQPARIIREHWLHDRATPMHSPTMPAPGFCERE